MLDWRWFRRLTLRLRSLFQRDRVERESKKSFNFTSTSGQSWKSVGGSPRRKHGAPPSARWLERSNERRSAGICGA